MRTIRAVWVAAVAAWLVAAAGGAARAQPHLKGVWSDPFDTQNVMIHASVLPTGKVLFWSRREAGEGLDPQDCQPRLFDPTTRAVSLTPKPGYNLFCAGHSFLSDGRLFVVGGHLKDSHGSDKVSLYDAGSNSWTAEKATRGGRWYPTAVTLPDGGVLVSFGSDKNGQANTTQEVWKDGAWRDTVGFNGPPLYPRMHVASDGRVLMAGPLTLTQRLDPAGAGAWTPLGDRINKYRDYAPSVLYDTDRVLYAGGGNAPTKAAEVLDLSAAMPQWKATGDMTLARRQHNATLLPDGTVLVTGGTQGNGGESNGFNDLTPGQPIRSAERWDPKTGTWTRLAKAAVDRCYHSVAVLLPDATVLSAGGGEYRPVDGVDQANDPKDTHKTGQVFSPPYLFKADGTAAERPVVTAAKAEVGYGETFAVATALPAQVGRVSWVRLSSVTHSIDMNQRINFLPFTTTPTGLLVTAPADANRCPPGHYMLFVLNTDGVPSHARVVRIH